MWQKYFFRLDSNTKFNTRIFEEDIVAKIYKCIAIFECVIISIHARLDWFGSSPKDGTGDRARLYYSKTVATIFTLISFQYHNLIVQLIIIIWLYCFNYREILFI